MALQYMGTAKVKRESISNIQGVFYTIILVRKYAMLL